MDDIWFSDTPLWMDSTTVSQFLDAIEGNGVYILGYIFYEGSILSHPYFMIGPHTLAKTEIMYPKNLSA